LVQELPSLQLAPFGLVGFEQRPVDVSHVPATWHWSDAEHTTPLTPTQMPAWQVSVWVQEFPSLQLEPLAFAGFVQAPVPGWQTPGSWH
jgi:hypothetical protein